MMYMNHANVRKNTIRVLELIDEGALDAREIAALALGWLADDEVASLIRANDLQELVFGEEEEVEEQEWWDFEEDEDTPSCSPV